MSGFDAILAAASQLETTTTKKKPVKSTMVFSSPGKDASHEHRGCAFLAIETIEGAPKRYSSEAPLVATVQVVTKSLETIEHSFAIMFNTSTLSRNVKRNYGMGTACQMSCGGGGSVILSTLHTDEYGWTRGRSMASRPYSRRGIEVLQLTSTRSVYTLGVAGIADVMSMQFSIEDPHTHADVTALYVNVEKML